MRLEPAVSDDPRDVLRALRAAVLGAGPAVALGGTGTRPRDVPAGTGVVVTTSGSTGIAKSVVLSRNALTSAAMATAARLGEGAWLLALPPTYVAGMQVLVRSLVAGREPAVLSGPFRAESFAAAARLMASSADGARVPTFTALVPVQLQRLLDAAADDSAVAAALRSFEAILIGGQALSPALRDRARELGARIVRTYGSTETSGGCVYDGRPLDGMRLRIERGEVQVAGPSLAEGYLDDVALTDAVFVPDEAGTRWYRTGDTGEIGADGALRVTGRIDDVIVSGGVNVSLARVEAVVRALPALADAVVVGVPDPTWGETAVVAVRRDVAVPGLLERVRDVVAAEIGVAARPARMLVLDDIPHLPSGKPDRVAIRRAAASADA
jgi:o-succinylbenzoate---CoA ligase